MFVYQYINLFYVDYDLFLYATDQVSKLVEACNFSHGLKSNKDMKATAINDFRKRQATSHSSIVLVRCFLNSSFGVVENRTKAK